MSRTQKTVANGGDLASTAVLHYDVAREIAEYNSAETTGIMTQAYVWGTQYVDELLMMFGRNGAYFAWQDANWLVSGLTTPGGRLAEEYNYTPYGRVLARRHTVFGDGDGDGEVVSTDDGHLGSGQTCWGAGPSGACRVFDFDQDGDLDSADQTVMTSLVGLASTHHVRLARTSGTTGGLFAHQGLFLDVEIGQYQNRKRGFGPQLHRFRQRDPLTTEPSAGLGFVDGAHFYQYVGSNPVMHSDHTGTRKCTQGRTNEYFTYHTCGARCFQQSRVCRHCRVCHCGDRWIEFDVICTPCARNSGNPPACPTYAQPSHNCCAFRRHPTENNCKQCCWDLAEGIQPPQARKEWREKCLLEKQCDQYK